MGNALSEEDRAAGLDWENLPTESGAAAHTDVVTGTGLAGDGEYVLVFPAADQIAETAKALNNAAVGREQLVVWSDGHFRVPRDVAEAADLPGEADAVVEPEPGSTSSLQGANPDHPAGKTGPVPDGDGGASGDSEEKDQFSEMTVQQLQDYAQDHEVDLGAATRKADIQAVLRQHVKDHPQA